MKKTRKAVLGAAATLAVVAGIGVGAVAGTAVATGTDDFNVVQPASVEYERNTSGETFGSASAVSDPQNEPDLIRVLATNGVEGYAKKADLDADQAATPQEARASARAASTERTVPVYAEDGDTVIGEFVITPANGSVTTD